MKKSFGIVLLSCIIFGCRADPINVSQECTEAGLLVKTDSKPSDDLIAKALEVCLLAMKEAGDELSEDITDVVFTVTDKAREYVVERTVISTSLKNVISDLDEFVGLKQLEDWGLEIKSLESRIWWQEQLLIFTYPHSISKQRLFDFGDRLWRVGARLVLDRVKKNEELSILDEVILQKASDVLIQLVESSYNANSTYSPEEAYNLFFTEIVRVSHKSVNLDKTVAEESIDQLINRMQTEIQKLSAASVVRAMQRELALYERTAKRRNPDYESVFVTLNLGKRRGFGRSYDELGEPQKNEWNFLVTEEEQLGELLYAQSEFILMAFRQNYSNNWKDPFEQTHVRAKYLKNSNYQRISEAGSMLMKENYALFDVYESNNGKPPKRRMSGFEFLAGMVDLIAAIAPYVGSGQGEYDAETAQAEFNRDQERRQRDTNDAIDFGMSLIGTAPGW